MYLGNLLFFIGGARRESESQGHKPSAASTITCAKNIVTLLSRCCSCCIAGARTESVLWDLLRLWSNQCRGGRHRFDYKWVFPGVASRLHAVSRRFQTQNILEHSRRAKGPRGVRVTRSQAVGSEQNNLCKGCRQSVHASILSQDHHKMTR
jgi:hypothetical protein